jgi:flagellar basal-body rod protein FlgF
VDRMVYLGMVGARDTAEAQAIVSNNLANANTTGFRADLEQLKSLPVYGPGQASRAYAVVQTPASDLTPSAPINTGRDLDVAVQGDGWIAVQAPDGTEAYTRAGDLHISTGGILTTGAGHPVLGNGGGPVALPPAQKVDIAADGTISVQPTGQTDMVVLDRIKLVRPPDSELTKGEDGLFRLASGDEAPADGTVRVVSGAIESSNVNSVDALVRMIDLSRTFDLQVKVMKEAESTDASATRLISMT